MNRFINVSEIADGIFQLQINDPFTRNGLHDALVDELVEALHTLGTKPDLRVLLLIGQPNVFCSGAIFEMLQELVNGQKQIKDMILPAALIRFPVPIVAALEGYAISGGLIIALCCDVTIASESSRYGVNFTNLGFTPGMGTTALLPALLGHHLAAEMMYSGKLYAGKALDGFRLFNRVVSKDKVLPLAKEIANEIAEKPRYVLELLKQTLCVPRQQMLEAALPVENMMHHICFRHPEFTAQFENKFLGSIPLA